MASLVLYFQMHQPHRLRRYSVFDTGTDYFDTDRNERICSRVVERSYSVVTSKLLELTQRHGGGFRFTLGITGSLIEQLRWWAPHVLDTLRAIAATGCMEVAAETSAHSLAFLHSRDEFAEQVDAHAAMVGESIGLHPTRTFRNTEMIFSNDVAHWAARQGYTAVLTEGADRVLEGRTPNQAYRPDDLEGPAVLTRNYRLSDDLAFRFGRCESMRSPDALLGTLDALDGPLCNIFIDMEALGEHQPATSGVFGFLDHLPESILTSEVHDFKTASEATAAMRERGRLPRLDAPEPISWADTARDLRQRQLAQRVDERRDEVAVGDRVPNVEGGVVVGFEQHAHHVGVELLGVGDERDDPHPVGVFLRLDHQRITRRLERPDHVGRPVVPLDHLGEVRVAEEGIDVVVVHGGHSSSASRPGSRMARSDSVIERMQNGSAAPSTRTPTKLPEQSQVTNWPPIQPRTSATTP